MSIGGFFKGIADVLTGGVIEKAASIIDKAVTDKDLAARLKHEFEMTAFITEAEVEKARIESETAIVQAQEATHQAEVNQSDVYTKRTRPKIARMSFYFASIYTLVSLVSKMTPELQDIEVSPEAFLLLASPALTYMGVRSLDIWRSGGAKQV